MRHIVILLAAGKGKRAGGDLPKQYRTLLNEPIFCIAAKAFLEENQHTEVVIVTDEEHEILCKEMVEEHLSEYINRISYCLGGDTRFQSVKNALESLKFKSDTLIAVHDAARPLLSKELVKNGWKTAQRFGTAIPVVPLIDSIRRKIDETHTVVEDRTKYVAVQTPQVFKGEILRESYSVSFKSYFTDDASVVENGGFEIASFKGEYRNFKITTPEDFERAGTIYINEIIS